MSAEKEQVANKNILASSIGLDMQEQNQHPNSPTSFLTAHSIPSRTSIYLPSSKEGDNKKSISQIQELYSQIHTTINDMDNKVQHVIKKHETQFLFAYRNHIKKIKKQLSQIKYKSQQQQKMFSSNDRIQYLQQQLAIFRDETMKAYNKLDQKNLQIDLLKLKVKDLEKEAAHANGQLKEYYRKCMVSEMNKGELAERIGQLESELEQKNVEIKKLVQKNSQSASGSKTTLRQQSSLGSKVFFLEDKLREIQKSKHSRLSKNDKSPLNTHNSSVHVSSSNFFNSGLPKQSRIYDTDLKQWFLQCIKTVKREVAQRNNNEKSLELNNISSIQEFMMVDKLRLLEIFLQNEKLLTFMYGKIFPDRLTSLRQKLSQSNKIFLPKTTQRQAVVLTERQEKVISQFNEGLISERYKPRPRYTNLPQVVMRTSSQKMKANNVRNNMKESYVLREGKLNVSMK